jgi:hypothetical protein
MMLHESTVRTSGVLPIAPVKPFAGFVVKDRVRFGTRRNMILKVVVRTKLRHPMDRLPNHAIVGSSIRKFRDK